MPIITFQVRYIVGDQPRKRDFGTARQDAINWARVMDRSAAAEVVRIAEETVWTASNGFA